MCEAVEYIVFRFDLNLFLLLAPLGKEGLVEFHLLLPFHPDLQSVFVHVFELGQISQRPKSFYDRQRFDTLVVVLESQPLSVILYFLLNTVFEIEERHYF